jgi:hypothetical protein
VLSSIKLLGIDFTSAPSRKKPITVCVGHFTHFSGSSLPTVQLQAIERLPNFGAFEALLDQSGCWFSAMDFPFAFPADWLLEQGWPTEWPETMAFVASLSKLEFEAYITSAMHAKPAGQKYRYRETDRRTRSSSPLKLFYPPVGKMFFQGATRLWKAPIAVLPCRERADATESEKYAVEAYPALISRRFSTGPYKSDTAAKQTIEKHMQRQAIWQGIHSEPFIEEFGFQVDSTAFSAAEVLNDPMGDPMADVLDAVLCCLQAAWAYSQQQNRYGIPAWINNNEGWIPDPALSQGE